MQYNGHAERSKTEKNEFVSQPDCQLLQWRSIRFNEPAQILSNLLEQDH